MSSPVVREGWDGSSGGPGRDIPARSRLRLVLPASAENVALVRHTVAAAAEERGLPLHIVEDMRLAVTEACTNVVRHAYKDEGDMRVDVDLSGPGMRVVVEDQGRGIGASTGTGTDDDGAGLGLPLIAALVSELEIERGRAHGSRLSMRFAIGAE